MSVFDKYWKKYDSWYEKNKFAYWSEVEAIKKVFPGYGKGLEIGVGTGRFASALGVKYGIEPSANMAAVARERGIDAKVAEGEKLPFGDAEFDYAVIVITLSFVKEPRRVIAEARRVLKDKGKIIIGIIDKKSFLGKTYRVKKTKGDIFYKQAHFLSVDEVVSFLKEEDFKPLCFYQTLFRPLEEIKNTEPVKEGYGEGGFVVISAQKSGRGRPLRGHPLS